MQTMKAASIYSCGGPEVLVYANAPRPRARAGEVQIRVHAAGVNPVDRKIREGHPQPLLSLPVVVSAPRTSGPPSQSERAKVQPTKTHPAPAAPAKSPRTVSPNPQVTPGTRPSVAPTRAESRQVQQEVPRASLTKPASNLPRGPAKPQEDSK